ncbi:hypothetical protein [Acidihalobacter yilgarnensis]|uniref:hypothetical protein n=1 Tax=Acidihalobacter yilgarnensis TaxID=2819280 RepID=UPI0012EAE568|nr:hypothetical protein [Acidihalobacter yilgarnensis]
MSLLKKIIIFVLGAVIIFVLADMANIVPTTAKTLGYCEFEADKAMASRRPYNDKPITDNAVSEWHSQHRDMVVSCMSSFGYEYDEPGEAKFTLKNQKILTNAYPDLNRNVIPSGYFRDEFSGFVKSYRHRWPWE